MMCRHLLMSCVMLLVGCAHHAVSKDATLAPRQSGPALDEAYVVDVGLSLAREKGWGLRDDRVPKARFIASKGTWVLGLRARDGNFNIVYFVYVNDTTREVQFVRGE
jgi:hypothetical protein